ncbi:DUF2333 family protein [Desulfosarcina sp. OttesenSCG-928-A07]|nr:DUF2333 family protein [Desulfosarcina sp. OttesenSCG-928-G17]MDL2330001.1 DUF2333 family protein [Desulfosarcina sp. OttesenSCG-928-A07]
MSFGKFATLHVIGSLIVAIIVLWAIIALFGPSRPPHLTSPSPPQAAPEAVPEQSPRQTTVAAVPKTPDTPEPAPAVADTPPSAAAPTPLPVVVSPTFARSASPKGVALVEAITQPLTHELKDRWWGWRPNDLISVTDNINNFQIGVLEVTRRATMALSDRIVRTGSTDAYNENVERAVNWFMVKADSFWFPSAESKYLDAIKELTLYAAKLKQGKAPFYNRADNLIPLLVSFEDILGSCNENLVKQFNEDGSPVSFFVVDDYFFYTQGVTSAIATILEAVLEDFQAPLESRNATDLVKYAIADCQRAAAIHPWIILDSDLDSMLANHRAHMATLVNHARFYLTQVIKALST